MTVEEIKKQIEDTKPLMRCIDEIASMSESKRKDFQKAMKQLYVKRYGK